MTKDSVFASNQYVYAAEDPVNYVDPSGNNPIVLLFAGAFAGAAAYTYESINNDSFTLTGLGTAFFKEGSLAAVGAGVGNLLAKATGKIVGAFSGKFASQGVANTKGWNVGDPIDNLTKTGKEPSWSTVKSRYWKNEAQNYSELHSKENFILMKKGRAPIHEDFYVSKELHHINGRNTSNPHNINNLKQVWPWEHADIDPFRFRNGPRP